MTPEGLKLERFLTGSITELKRQPMAGGKFFALTDEISASEARLDKLAEPLLEKLASTEEMAKRAVEAKHAKLDAVADYIKRMGQVATDLGEGGNGGPSLAGASSEHSGTNSDEQK